MWIRLSICIFIFSLGLFGSACNIINPKEQVPTYVHIDSFRVVTNSKFTNLSYSHDINNVWVYCNNNLVGEFDLPATFPVIVSDTGHLTLAAGVSENGQNNLVLQYPFYVYDNSTLTAHPGKVINYTPTTTYYSNITTNVISNFEGGIYFAQCGGDQGISIAPDSLAYEGHGAGVIYLKAVGDSSIDSSVSSFTIPINTQAYVEFNYRSTIPFFIGIQANLSTLISSTQYYLAGIAPSSTWGKFYLNVSDFASKYQATSYTFYIKAVLGDGQTSGRLLIDNIQLIYF